MYAAATRPSISLRSDPPLSPFVMKFFVDSGIPTFLAIVITVLVLGVVIGGINGIATTVFGVPSLITTLGSGYIIFGYALTISSAQQINLPTESLGLGRWFGGEAWSRRSAQVDRGSYAASKTERIAVYRHAAAPIVAACQTSW